MRLFLTIVFAAVTFLSALTFITECCLHDFYWGLLAPVPVVCVLAIVELNKI